MYVFSVFELSIKTEDAITALQTKGITKESILAVPLDSRNESKGLFDTTHYSDNSSTLAFPLIMAMMCTLLGSVFGFQLKWGPIIWGLLGAIIGMALGLSVSLTIAIIKKRRQRRAAKPSVIVIVNCADDQVDFVQDIFWHNAAIGVHALKLS